MVPGKVVPIEVARRRAMPGKVQPKARKPWQGVWRHLSAWLAGRATGKVLLAGLTAGMVLGALAATAVQSVHHADDLTPPTKFERINLVRP